MKDRILDLTLHRVPADRVDGHPAFYEDDGDGTYRLTVGGLIFLLFGVDMS